MQFRRHTDNSRVDPPRVNAFTLLLSYLIPADRRNAFLDWYAYLRWVDDFADEASVDATVQPFLNRQYLLLEGEGPCHHALLTSQERSLVSLIAENRIGGGVVLASLIRDMLDCIEFDARRRGILTSHERLRGYWLKEVRSYLSAIAWFCGIWQDGDPPGLRGAEGAKIVHVLRDLRKDIGGNQINVSCEEVAAFGISLERVIASTGEAEVGRWVAANARVARQMLWQGLEEVRGCSGLRYKLVVVLLITKYQCYVNPMLRDGLIATFGLCPYEFLTQFMRNLIVCFTGPPRSRRREVLDHPVVRPTSRARLALYSGLVVGTARSELADLYRSLGPARKKVGDAGRVRRRFRVACLLGRTAFEVVAPAASRLPDLRFAAGLLYGYWAISAVELDRLMDEGILDREKAQAVAGAWTCLFRRTLFEMRESSGTIDALVCAGDVFRSLTNGFLRTLRAYGALCRDNGLPGWGHEVKEAFYSRAVSLMEGQLRSLCQMRLDQTHDWSWYCANILNSKNVEFLLAPFNLWRVDEDSDQRFTQFVRQFERLNRAYLHYQLIDDVADLAEDADEGIIGAPGAVVLAQGRLGRSILEFSADAMAAGRTASDGDACRVVAAVKERGLADGDLADAPLFDRFRHRFGGLVVSPQQRLDGDVYLRCALANRESDLSLATMDLLRRRDQEARSYIDALGNGDSPAAQRWLLRSGAPNRILNAVGHEAAVIDLRRALDTDRGSASTRLLYVLERLMRHTYQAALNVVAHPIS